MTFRTSHSNWAASQRVTQFNIQVLNLKKWTESKLCPAFLLAFTLNLGTHPWRPIPTRWLTTTPTGRRTMAIGRRPVSSEISNMFDKSQRSPIAQRRRSPSDQSPSWPLNRPYPLGDRRYNRHYNWPTTADCSADCSADRLVGMVYLVDTLSFHSTCTYHKVKGNIDLHPLDISFYDHGPRFMRVWYQGVKTLFVLSSFPK